MLETGKGIIENRLPQVSFPSFCIYPGWKIRTEFAKGGWLNGYYLHHVPGRLRIKTPFVKNNTENATIIQELLQDIPGVTSTSVNIMTGSVLVHYDPRVVSPKAITDTLTRRGYFDQSKAMSNDQYIHSAASKVSTWAWKTAFGTILGEALGGSELAFLAVLI